MDVRTGDGDALFVALFQTPGEFGDRGGLAGTLQTRHEHDGRRAGAQRELAALAAPHDADEFVVDDLDQRLARRDAAHDLAPEGALACLLDELLDHRQGHVGLEQRHADLAHGGADIILGQAALAADILEGATEALGETVEHGAAIPYRPQGRVSVRGLAGTGGAGHPRWQERIIA
jgi:hypothetical protein